MSERRPFGGLESEILAVLDTAAGALSVAEVRAGLGEGLAYTTVVTVLSRLAGKGLVVRRRDGRAHRYSIVRDPAEVTAWRMRRLLDSDRNRSAALARFVGDLSDDDEQLLLEVLRENRRGRA
ncbi:BlaI/MecI/CopY family transcriptional regulator [Actinoplanes sp. NPDC051411]|uniref:BlaI/MecI/CopY family transcriptional regulator n=1 Tax=Actinoplanes sp. NPDC051411 TaxID=3155522 RepID=UPI00343DB916